MPREPHETMMKTVKSKTDDHEGEGNGREGKKKSKRRKTQKDKETQLREPDRGVGRRRWVTSSEKDVGV